MEGALRARHAMAGIFDDVFGLSIVTHGDFRIWTPSHEVLNPGGAHQRCRRVLHEDTGPSSSLRLNYPGETAINATMCLFNGANMISDAVARNGRWPDCDPLIRAWRTLPRAPSQRILDVRRLGDQQVHVECGSFIYHWSHDHAVCGRSSVRNSAPCVAPSGHHSLGTAVHVRACTPCSYRSLNIESHDGTIFAIIRGPSI